MITKSECMCVCKSMFVCFPVYKYNFKLFTMMSERASVRVLRNVDVLLPYLALSLLSLSLPLLSKFMAFLFLGSLINLLLFLLLFHFLFCCFYCYFCFPFHSFIFIPYLIGNLFTRLCFLFFSFVVIV